MKPNDIDTILRLRLIICRAAQSDSLDWWADNSLTSDGLFIAERLFGNRPRVAAGRIALASALSRHKAAIPASPNSVHLFDFGDEVEFEISKTQLSQEWIPADPITTLAALDSALDATQPARVEYSQSEVGENGAMEIKLAEKPHPPLNLRLAEAIALASSYRTAQPGRPVFPFIRKAE